LTAVISWQPFETVRRSFSVLLSVLTGMVDLVIMIAIAVLPPVFILALLVWLSLKAWQALRGRARMRTS
jgi:hypothetical protein